MEKRKTTIVDDLKVESFGLSDGLHEIATDMVKNNKRKVGSYTLEEVDGEMANVWIADAHSEGEEDYAEMLREAIAKGADIYTLTDHLGEFSQPIGEVAVYEVAYNAADDEDTYDEADFYDALVGYGELEHDVIMDITDGKPIIINGKEVDSILDDDGLKFSYIGANGAAYSTRLNIDDIDNEICDRIYEFLCGNRNVNTDFFNELG
jgi:hypothetical protein